MKFSKFILIQGNSLFPLLYPLLRSILNKNYLKGIKFFYRDMILYKKLDKVNESPFKLSLYNNNPYYFDRFDEAGGVLMHYFHQDIWASNKVYKSEVKRHYDIGSRLDGFIAHCLSFCKVVMLDIRLLPIKIPNLEFIQTDCMNMKNIKSGSINSISSLHAIEHFGLGRYGDPIDPWGYKKAIDEMKRVTKKGGNIYFSVPIGVQRVEFNAHRVFNPLYIVELFEGCRLIEFSAIDDSNNFIKSSRLNKFLNKKFSCGLYHFKKN